jgi:hypothetical protein
MAAPAMAFCMFDSCSEPPHAIASAEPTRAKIRTNYGLTASELSNRVNPNICTAV